MNQDKTELDGGASRLHAELEDARRYRWLLVTLQTAYDGNDMEIGDMIIGCRMTWARRGARRCQAELIWDDKRDEPLGLSDAIDAAMALSSNAIAQGREHSERPAGAEG